MIPDRHGHPGVEGGASQRQVVLGVVEDLGDRQVRARGLLGGQHLDTGAVVDIGRVGGHGDLEVAGAVVEVVGLDLADDAHQVVGVRELPGDVLGGEAPRRVAAQGQEAAHAHVEEVTDDLDDAVLAVADAGQVRHERHL